MEGGGGEDGSVNARGVHVYAMYLQNWMFPGLYHNEISIQYRRTPSTLDTCRYTCM